MCGRSHGGTHRRCCQRCFRRVFDEVEVCCFLGFPAHAVQPVHKLPAIVAVQGPKTTECVCIAVDVVSIPCSGKAFMFFPQHQRSSFQPFTAASLLRLQNSDMLDACLEDGAKSFRESGEGNQSICCANCYRFIQ